MKQRYRPPKAKPSKRNVPGGYDWRKLVPVAPGHPAPKKDPSP